MSENESTFEWPDPDTNWDRFTRLAWAMECEPNEVSRLIQQHAPWNGRSACDAALRERAAIVTCLRWLADHEPRISPQLLNDVANGIERGEHISPEKTP